MGVEDDPRMPKVVNLEDKRKPEWRNRLVVKVKKDGTEIIPPIAHNIVMALNNSPNWQNRIKLNTFNYTVNIDGRDIEENDALVLKVWLEENFFRSKVLNNDVYDAVTLVAHANPFHPIRDYLKGLVWDGLPRVGRLFIEHMGADDNEYNNAAAKSFLVTAVARVMEPGCKVDTMIVLEGGQGGYKTSFFELMFGRENRSSTNASIYDKDFLQNMAGTWCYDFGELEQFSAKTTLKLKELITDSEDKYRKSYGRSPGRYKRQCIFVGSTNNTSLGWLHDHTGNRRFLPVEVKKSIDLKVIANIRDQLWAEAVELYKSGYQWWIIPGADIEQEKRFCSDESWENIVSNYLDEHMEILSTTSGEMLGKALGLDIGKHDQASLTRIGIIMHRLGWKKRRVMFQGERTQSWRYFRFD